MPLLSVDLEAPAKGIDWLVPGLIPCGFLTILGSLPGAGKTAVVSGLAWQLSRRKGDFLGRELETAASVYLDFDAPSEGRGFRLWLDRHQARYPDGDIKAITVFEPDSATFGLGDFELEQLTKWVQVSKARLIVVDSFMAAFGRINPNSLEQVMGALWHLRRLAHQTGAAVLLIDHLPKPLSGEKAGARGILGSQAKQAQARAVHVLTRVPPREVEERHVLRWETTKLSFAVLPEPFGLELSFEGGLELKNYQLPEGSSTRTNKATQLVEEHLKQRAGEVVPRAEVVKLIDERFNLSKRLQDVAITAALERLGSVRKVKLPGQGHPVGYRLDIGIRVSETEQTTSQTDNVLDTAKVSNGIRVSETSGQELLERAWHLLERLGLPEPERQSWSVRLNRQREAAAAELLGRFGG